MIWASCRKASGDMVPGFRVLMATLVVPFQVPASQPQNRHLAERHLYSLDWGVFLRRQVCLQEATHAHAQWSDQTVLLGSLAEFPLHRQQKGRLKQSPTSWLTASYLRPAYIQ